MILYVLVYDRLINCTASTDKDVESEHDCSYGIMFKITSHEGLFDLDNMALIVEIILFIIQIFLTLYELGCYLRISGY